MINIIFKSCAVRSEVSNWIWGWGLHLGEKDLTKKISLTRCALHVQPDNSISHRNILFKRNLIVSFSLEGNFVFKYYIQG